eukprot:15350875-Alexandrium_andersonii.AAC.1
MARDSSLQDTDIAGPHELQLGALHPSSFNAFMKMRRPSRGVSMPEKSVLTYIVLASTFSSRSLWGDLAKIFE